MNVHTSAPLPVSSHAVADLLCTIIVLCRGLDIENKPFWAYLCMKPSMAQAFREAREGGGFDLAEYGTILESGDGEEPPPGVQRRMARDYGVNPRLEEEWLAAIVAAGQNEP